MKFSPKCRTKKLGVIYTNLGNFCSFFNWEVLVKYRERSGSVVECLTGDRGAAGLQFLIVVFPDHIHLLFLSLTGGTVLCP